MQPASITSRLKFAKEIKKVVQKAGEKSSSNSNTPINDRANLPLKAVKYKHNTSISFSQRKSVSFP